MECDNLFYICLIVLRKVYEFIWKESLVLLVVLGNYVLVFFDVLEILVNIFK